MSARFEEGAFDPGIEEALSRLGRPRAREAFAARLRAEFVSGSFEAESASRAEGSRRTTPVSAPGGSEPPTAAPPTPPLEPLFDQAPIAEPAREAFRRELRAAFVAGELEERAESAPDRPVRPVRRARPGRIERGSGRASGPSRTRRLLLLSAGLAAAAMLLLFLRGIVGGPEPAPRWVARDLGQLGEVRVGGESHPAADLEAVARALNDCEELETDACPVEVVLDGNLRLRVGRGSLLHPLPRTGAEEAAVASLPFELVRGEIWIQTVAGYTGAPLEVETPEARVRIVGTVLSIAAGVSGTCVCVDRGKVVVTPKQAGEAVRPVASHTTCFVFSDPGQGIYEGTFEATVEQMPSMGESHYPELREFASGRP